MLGTSDQVQEPGTRNREPGHRFQEPGPGDARTGTKFEANLSPSQGQCSRSIRIHLSSPSQSLFSTILAPQQLRIRLSVMPIKLHLHIEISGRRPRLVRTRLRYLYARACHALGRGQISHTTRLKTPSISSDPPSFWCSGLADDYDAWPGPPPYHATIPLTPVVALCELDDQATWVRQSPDEPIVPYTHEVEAGVAA